MLPFVDSQEDKYYKRLHKGRRDAVDKENLFRVAWLKKAGCLDKEIQEQHTPLTYDEVWARWQNSFQSQSGETGYGWNRGWSESRSAPPYNQTLTSFREELYLLPCVKVQDTR